MINAAAATKDTFHVAPRFSNHFDINKPQFELEFVDILMDTDVRLYVDPYALSIEEDEWSVECHNLIFGFFQELVDAIRESRLSDAAHLLSNLHEPNETKLGQSRGRPKGRGLGKLQAMSVYRAFAKSKAVESGVLTDLSDCELFIDGISHDKISDMATNVIRRMLTDFTTAQCERWGVPTELRPAGVSWDGHRKDWRNNYARLPVYHGQPIILVPKRAVRYQMAIDNRTYYNTEVVEFIRSNYLQAEHLKPGSSLFKLLRAGRKVSKRDVEDEFPKSKDFLRTVSEQFPELLKRYKRRAREAAERGENKPTDSGIYELEKKTAHAQGWILKEEVHLTINNITGGVVGSIGDGNQVSIRDINLYKQTVDATQTISASTRALLKRAVDEIEAADLPDGDKNDAKQNLQKLTDELAGEKKPGMIERHLTRLAQVLPAAATVLKSGEEIAHLLSQLPNPFAG